MGTRINQRKEKTKAGRNGRVIVRKDVEDLSNDPVVIAKKKEAEAFLKKIGLPTQQKQ